MPNKETLLLPRVGAHRVAFALIVLFVIMVTGCVAPELHMEHLQGLEGPSPLHAITPLNFVILEFKDPPYKDGFLQLDRKPSEIVSNAIAAELVRNGHRVLSDQDAAKADVILDGTVTDFIVKFYRDTWENTLDTTITITLQLTSNIEQRHILSKEYKGVTEPLRCALCAGPFGIAEGLLKQALRSLVRDVMMDPDFINVLKEISDRRQPARVERNSVSVLHRMNARLDSMYLIL